MMLYFIIKTLIKRKSVFFVYKVRVFKSFTLIVRFSDVPLTSPYVFIAEKNFRDNIRK